MSITGIVITAVALVGGVKTFRREKRKKPSSLMAALKIGENKPLRKGRRIRQNPSRTRLIDVLTPTLPPLDSEPLSKMETVPILHRSKSGKGEWLHQSVRILQEMPQKAYYLGLYFSDLRYQHRETIADGAIEISEIEKSSGLRVKISFVNLGLTIFAITVYPPVLLAAAPLYLYTISAVYRDALRSLIKEHRITPTFLSAIASSALLIGGMFFTASVELCISSIIRHLVIKSEDHSKRNLFSLFGKQSKTVWIVQDEVEIEIPLEEVQAEDIVVVGAGQIIPVDGVIVAGMASIDQHMLTGESQPVEKIKGDKVLTSTVVYSGKIRILVEKTGEETVAAQIGHILNQTQDFREIIKSRADAQSSKMMTPILILSALAYPIGGANSVAALLMNKPAYNMRYFGPISMLNYLNVAALQNILVKDGRSLELLRDIDMIVFDKTGTLTLETPKVQNIYVYNDLSADELLRLTAAAEARQSHPIARAILSAAKAKQLDLPSIEDIHVEIGYGIKANFSTGVVRVGSERFMTMEGILIPDEIHQLQLSCHQKGYSLIMVAIGRELAGAIELRPTIRPEALKVTQELQKRGLELVIISGDHEGPTKQLAQQLNIERYFSQVLPEDKANLVEQLQQEGHSVCFVGDGINDAIALKKAKVSISLCGATTVATDTAQIVLMDGKLTKLIDLFDIGQEYEQILKSNLVISTIPASLCIGGVFLFGWSALTAIIIGQSALFIGFLNCVRPLLKHMNHTNQRSNDDKQNEWRLRIEE